MRSSASEPWASTLVRWVKVVLAIDLALIAVSLLIVGGRGTWSARSIGETLWWIASAVGLAWGVYIAAKGGLLQISIFARSGVMVPGEMSQLLRADRWDEIRELSALAFSVFASLSLLAWAIWSLG